MNWNKYFEYVDGKLYWKEREVNTRHDKMWNTRYAGKEAGRLDRGYVRVVLFNKHYRAHRIIYAMHQGPIPEKLQIDHINGIKNDNRIENLRVVTNQENCKNKNKPKNNTSGAVGVFWNKCAKKWVAQIDNKNIRIYLGCFQNKTDAIKARKDAEKFYGFHKNHGKALDTTE